MLLDGDPSTPIFDSNLVAGTTYGGINIDHETVTLDTSHLSGLAAGHYQLVIFEASAPSVRVIIPFNISHQPRFQTHQR